MKKAARLLSRRDFVQTSVKGIIGLAVMPTILTSCSNWKGANDRITVAHIGVGSRGTDELISYFLPVKDAMNIAVADTFKRRRENAVNVINTYYKDNKLATPECKAYLNFQEILERKDIDAVHITTPDHWHVPAAILSARAGKHIMLAKPLGLSYPDFMKLKAEVAKYDVRFHYGTQQRTSPHMQLACNLIEEGVIGDIVRADVWAPGGGGENPQCKEAPVPDGFDYERWTGPAPLHPYCPERVTNIGSWYTNDYSIGFLAGWGAHPLDEAIISDTISHMGDIAIRTGRKVTWDPIKGEVTGDHEANRQYIRELRSPYTI